VTVETARTKTVIELSDELSTESIVYELLLPIISSLTFLPSQTREIAQGLMEATISIGELKNNAIYWE
jgi:hypothetical protein